MSTGVHVVFTWLHILPGLAGNQLEIATWLNWQTLTLDAAAYTKVIKF